LATLTVGISDADWDRLAGVLADEVARRLGSTGVGTTDAPEPTVADPWDTPWPSQAPADNTPSTTATAPSGHQSAGPSATTPTTAAAPPGQTGTVTVNAKSGPQQWTLGAANAPACKHGQSAAFVQGFTNGKPWKMWRCALGVGDQWRNKCDFTQWA
jgi:hypothetical protein